MPINPNGFVLLTVLIFLQIFSLLGLYGLSSVLMIQKTNQHHWQREVGVVAAQNSMRLLEEEVISSKANCLKMTIAPSEIVNQSLAWWQRNACRVLTSSDHQFYRVEFTGQNACVGIHLDDNKHTVTARFYRITLLTFQASFFKTKQLLQSTIAKPGDQAILCPGKVTVLNAGVQSRRELYS